MSRKGYLQPGDPQVSNEVMTEPTPERRAVCRDAVVDDALAIARVWVAAWQAAYAGLMREDYLASLDAAAALPGFERALREHRQSS